MINAFKMLGKSILQKQGYDHADEMGKREIFLKHQSIVPMSKKEDGEHAISLHFDTRKKEFWFELDKEITRENREYFFAFSVGSPGDKKKFFSTNNVSSFYEKFLTDSLKYLEDKRKKAKSKQWVSENILEDYDNFLETLLDMFYVKDGNTHFLNKDLLRTDQKQIFDKIELEHSGKKPEELFNRFLNKKFFNRDSKDDKKDFPPIFLAKIDGRHLLAHEEHRTPYVNLVHYDLFERFFVEGGKKGKSCHVCGEVTETVGDAPFQMKFYGTTNPLYFENLKKQNAYKSFSICRECLAQVLTGMRYVRHALQKSVLGVICYMIPRFKDAETDFERKYKRIFNLLNAKQGYKEDMDEIERLVRKSGKKNFSFDLLFFDSPPGSQAFDIVRLISNIEYQRLVPKLASFDAFSREYDLPLLNQSLTLNDVRFNLFPSQRSHEGKQVVRLCRKDVLDLFEAFLHEHRINYADIMKRFMDIYKRRFHRDHADGLSPFKMVLILSIFNKITPLKGAAMNEGSAVTEIRNSDYTHFFDTHKDIYQENHYRQGLFLLGTVINGIVSAQQKKASKKEDAGEGNDKKGKKPSSTFLKKLNYSGIPSRRVSHLVAEVRNYTEIYDTYEEPGIWGNIMDRLQGIEGSRMKGEEVVFYILTGISYSKYLGMVKSARK